MRLVWSVIPLVLIVSLIGIVGMQNADASCVRNQDWLKAPCFDTGPVPKSTFAERWSPYYEHKGSELMESKKIEMFQSLENKTFDEWVYATENYNENFNIYSYYVSIGKIAPQFPNTMIVDEYMSPKKQQSLFTKSYDLKCKNGLQPIILQSENYACVKSETRDKLLEMNLIHDDYSLIIIFSSGRGNNHDLNSFSHITMRNEGMVPIQFDSPSIDIPIWQTRQYDSESLHPGEQVSYRPWSQNQLDELEPGQHTIEIIYHSDIHKEEKRLNYEINLHAELKNKSKIINGCKSVGGTWLDDYNECESSSIEKPFENYCDNFNGTYDQCNSSCRHYPAGSDRVCTSQCIAVCEFD